MHMQNDCLEFGMAFAVYGHVNFLDWVDETLYLLVQVIKWVFQRLPNMGFLEIPIAEANYFQPEK